MAIEIVAPIGEIEVHDRSWDAVVSSNQFTLDVDSKEGEIEITTGIVVEGAPYTGEYEARALFSKQVFPTAMKTMRKDFSVNAINYTEAPNDSGITLTIGG